MQHPIWLWFTLILKGGTPGLKGHQWKKVDDGERIWPMYVAQAGRFFLSFVLIFFSLFWHLYILIQGRHSKSMVRHWGGLWRGDGSGGLSLSNIFWFSLFKRVNGDGAKPLATRSSCWMGLSIAATTATALTMTMTPGDWHASVTPDIQPTEYILVLKSFLMLYISW